MGLHLLIVGQYPRNDFHGRELDPVARLADKYAVADHNSSFVMRRSGSPRELIKAVRRVAEETGSLLDVLDIFDHGGHGTQRLGGTVLFDDFGAGRNVARMLRPFLATDARVRLLGCETAREAPGRVLLRSLRDQFGGSVVVFGTIERMEAGVEFGERGFKSELEREFLFSSTEADERIAPDHNQRIRERRSWYSEITA